MKVTDFFVLRPDVQLIQLRRLPDEVRARLDDDDDAYAIARLHSRIPASLIDREAAQLLEEFREPRTIVEAILRYSLPRSTNPETVLEDSLPLLARLVASQDLVAPDAALADAVAASLAPGDTVGEFTVVRCVQLLDDTEVYEIAGSGGPGALKLARAGTPAAASLAREATILARLDGIVAPRGLGHGTHGSREFVVVEWCHGVDAETAARSLRDRVAGEDRPGLLTLCQAIARAYTRLHDAGVIHGDVHPNNVLFDEAASEPVRIIDFGLARIPDDERLSDIPRGGVGPFLDPEYAACVVSGKPPLAVTAAAEQYSLAALLYFLVVGSHHREFAVDREDMFKQIAESVPLAFSERGVAPWPDLEPILRRGLQKDPERRFPSVGALAAALGQVQVGRLSTREFLATAAGSKRTAVIQELVAGIGPGRDGMATAFGDGPTASVNYGAAGLAYGLYRIASVEQSAHVLAIADMWSLRALGEITQPRAFANADLDIYRETVGDVSPFHTASGVYAVRALIDHAMGEKASQASNVEQFLTAVQAPCANLDLTLGRSGALLVSAVLREATGDPAIDPVGNALHADLVAELAGLPSIVEGSPRLPFLGIAHGWAGVMFSILRWCHASDMAVPAEVEGRLDELRSLGEWRGGLVSWPVSLSAESPTLSMLGWCHGSAGYVFLWALASRLLRRPEFLDVAAGAARSSLAGTGGATLCCGLAGRAYGMLAIYRETGESFWLDSARVLAGRAVAAQVSDDDHRYSLYKGNLGVAVLIADLAMPEWAAMPFFESEGWARAFGSEWR